MPIKCENPCLPSPEGRGEVTLQTRKKKFYCSFSTPRATWLDSIPVRSAQLFWTANSELRLCWRRWISGAPFRVSVSSCKVRISESQRIGGCLPFSSHPDKGLLWPGWTPHAAAGSGLVWPGLAIPLHGRQLQKCSSRNAALALGWAGGELGGCCVTGVWGFTTPLGQH